MGRIRKVRNVELVKLDLPFMRAIESGDNLEQARIFAEKQILRDIAQAFSLSSYRSQTTLNSAWPEGLPRPSEE